MKTAALFLAAMAALCSISSPISAATVGPAGYNNDFAAQPPAADWATFSRAGGANDAYEVDADVNATITAAGITTQVGPGTGTPPAALATAVWHSSAFYLQTRPTGNRFTALMAKFVNDTGTNATEFRIAYDFTIAAGGIVEETGRGNRVYYSLTGLSGSWVNVTPLNTSASANATAPVAATVSVVWPNGGQLYILWTDDNATGQGTDSANQIDNFALQVTAGTPLSTALTARLTAPTNNAVFLSGSTISAASSVSLGTGPYTVQYFISAGAGNTTFSPAGSASTAPFNVDLGALTPGTYNVYGAATDSAVPAATTNTLTNTFFVADPIGIALTSPANGATFDSTTSVIGAATVSGGTPPYSLQFLLDNIPNGPAISSAPFERNFGALFVGDHTIRAQVTDSKGWVSNSIVHAVHVTGPLGVTLTPANGASFNFGQSVTLAAAPGGGAPPYFLAFYTNGVLAGSGATSIDLGVLPPGSYASYVHVTDSGSQQADSTLNTFTIAPNPIGVTLTAPTNSQSGFPGSTLALAATASVNLPLTITNVAFYYDGVLAGNDAEAPYSGSVGNTTQGNHTVYAVATDSLGRQSFSQTNQVAITAPPGSNDLFVNAIPLFGPVVSTTGNNTTATKQFGGGGGEPAFVGGSLGGASLWWTWTATASGQTTIDTSGSDFDTILGVFTGSAQNQLTLVADNNDSEGNTWSRVQFNAVGGTVYRIVVDGNGPLRFPPTPERGNIRLNIKGVGGVEIASPASGAVFTFGDPIPVNVTITPDFPNPPASRVDFYIGNTLFGSSSTAPYSAVVTNAPAGSNMIYAVGLDSTGSPVQSPAVPIFVQKIGVTILTPFEDTVFQTTTNPITVTAWAYLLSGSITNIEFFVDGVKIGEDATSPFAATWTNVTAGSHRITAIGRSDAGVAYNSQPVNIGVASVLVPFASAWKYLDNGSDQGVGWISPAFDDSTWLAGPAPLGYSDSNGRLPATTNSFGPDPNAKYITTYFRQSFIATNIASFSQIQLSIERDDGAIVYLNGVEIGRFNMPTGLVTSATAASANAGDDGGTVFNLNINASSLQEGLNTFAVEIHQDTGTSTDIWFQMRLTGIPIIIHNISPIATLTSPTNNQYFLAPSSITLQAEASDPDGSVAKVEFFADGVEIGEATSAPYSVVWNNPSVAAHTLTVVATDDLGGTTTSAEVPIVVYDAAGTPVAAVTSPANGAVMEGPTNLLITATANAITGVANVQFYANGVEFGSDTTASYSAIWTAPFGTNILTVVATDGNGVRGTSPPITVTITIPPTNVIAPTLMAQFPAAGSTITNLTNITVTFSEYVQNIDASDLLINGVPATSVNGNHSRSNYTFTFAHPPYGQVNITWAGGHGITDYGWPTVLPFDETASTASWSYTLIDQTAPTIASRTPAAASTVTNLQQITVTFAEPVTGVDASDLLVNGGPAFEMSGSGTTYTFHVSQPPSGTVNVTWSTNNGIFDQAVIPNAFNRTAPGSAWTFTLDARAVLVQSNSVWRFVKGTAEASDPTNAWRQLAFDDSSWSNAPAPFFFGDPYTNSLIQGTFLSDMLSNYTTIYLRQEFTVNNRGNITSLLLNAQSDDGFIAWINGVEVRRVNVPGGEQPYNGVASAAAQEPQNTGAGYVVATLPAAAVAALKDGRNVLTVHAFNQNLTNSTDFGFNAQLYTFPIEPGTVAPRLLAPSPVPGDVEALTQITITFSEPVSGVGEDDLLINGAQASGVTSTTNTTYTFHFDQPPYGTVFVTWATNHGITDFDGPPKPFDGTASASTFSYSLLNPSNPKVFTQAPVASSTVTGLTSVVVTFTEPVSGVDASDFLVSGSPATSVTSANGISYSFTFAQPAYGSVPIRWVTNHGIVDIEAGNSFDPTRFGGQWNYTLVDPAPSVTITSPTNGTYRLEPANVAITATATDNDGTVASVTFYSNGSLLGLSTNAPYSISVSNLLQGAYVLRAVATDNMGLLGTSAPVVLNVVTSLPAFLVRGPYLQMGSPTGGVVRWRSDVFTDGLVYYGTDPLNLTNYATETTLTNEHIVQISGLNADTRYYYSIGSAAQRLAGTNGLASDFWFKTSPVPGTRGPVRIWAIGDAGTAGNGAPDRQASTRDAFYNYEASSGKPADLWMMLGDNAYNSGTDGEHQRAVFDMYPSILRNRFLWPALGNHETSQSATATDFPYLHIFSLPKNAEAGGLASGTEKYYSFDYANIHFICLDSMTSGQTGTTPMADWLRSDLAAVTAEWVIVYFHHPPYTKGSHDSDREGDLVAIRANIVPILESNSVDIVLSGHSHCYERSYLLHGHYGASTTISDSMKLDGGDGRIDGDGPYEKDAEGHGVVYAVGGSSGQATGGPLNHPAYFISLNELGSIVMDVSGNRMDVRFLRETGELQDHFTLLKPDPRPAAPLNLVALPVAATQVSLAWNDVATNELGYVVERSSNGTTFAPVLALDANAVSALDSGLLENATYYYRVRTTNASGASDFSNVASITTVNATAAPAAPSNLTAASDNEDDLFYRSRMILSWNDNSSNEAAFQIERSTDALAFLPVATVGANTRSYLDGGLDSGTIYFYRLRALNAIGQSAPTATASDQTHPQSQLVQAGATITLHAGIEGAPLMRYQWQKNGSDLIGETNQTLVMTNAWVNHDGEYAVVLRDNNGLISITKPATLTVAASPKISVHPLGGLYQQGSDIVLNVVADGSQPLAFRWRKNNTDLNIPGSDTPTITLSSVHVPDQGNFDVVITNIYGSLTSHVAAIRVAAGPALVQLPNVVAEVLRPLILTNIAIDPNDPPLSLVFSLEPGAPTNAYIGAKNGLFSWTPNRSQAPGTNDITIAVADQSNPTLRNTMTFRVRVNEYVELGLGSMIMLGGTNATIPITLFAGVPLSQAQATLNFPGEYFTDVSHVPGAAAGGSVAFQRTSSGTATLTFNPGAAGSIVGSNQFGSLRLVTAPITNTTVVPLRVASINLTPINSAAAPTLLASNGQVIIVGTRPLLDAHFTPLGGREVTIFAVPGSYNLDFSTNLAEGIWRRRAVVGVTSNLFRAVATGNNPPTNLPGFFRATR
jgi:acid phosphatase type 7